eukprot:INCI19245.2.p1 GENE.INCI19245.2~~INCI19245.2.p1  ORF type:complete len:343 (-),score=54.19 INCI19245.2:43-1071(-)
MSSDGTPRVKGVTKVHVANSVYTDLLRTCMGAGKSTFGVLTGWCELSAKKREVTDEGDEQGASRRASEGGGGDCADEALRNAGPMDCTHVVGQFHLVQFHGAMQEPGGAVASETWAKALRKLNLELTDVVGWFSFRGNSRAVPSARETSFHMMLQGAVGKHAPLVFMLINLNDSASILGLTSNVFKIEPEPQNFADLSSAGGSGRSGSSAHAQQDGDGEAPRLLVTPCSVISIANFKTIPENIYAQFLHCCGPRRLGFPVKQDAAVEEFGGSGATVKRMRIEKQPDEVSLGLQKGIATAKLSLTSPLVAEIASNLERMTSILKLRQQRLLQSSATSVAEGTN